MRTRILATLAALGFLACAGRPSSHEPTRSEMEAFRTRVLTVLGERYPARHFQPLDDPLEIESEDMKIGLQNLFVRSRQEATTSQEVDAMIKDHFSAVFGGLGSIAESPSWESARPRLRPQLMPSEFLAKLPAAHRPFCEGVVQAYVVDLPASYQYVTLDNLKKWNVTLSAVDESATANLEAASKATELTALKGEQKLLLVGTGDGYDAARILLPSFRRFVIQQLGEPFNAAVPNRDLLILWGSTSPPEFQAHVREMISESFRTQPYPLTPSILRVTQERIIATGEEDAA